MKLVPQCIGCLFNQMERAFRLLNPQISPEIIINAQKRLMEYFLTLNGTEESSIVGKKTYEIISETLGVEDPYESIKIEYNSLALKFYEDARKIVNASSNPVLKALIISALGNTIDFGASHNIDFIKDIEEFTANMLPVNDFKEFKISITSSTDLLILGDNCGEIVFDKLLIETFKKHYPDLKIVYAIRAGPIINDVTIKDAEFVGLTNIAEVIEASQTPGIYLPSTSEEFKQIFFLKGGMILSKGQGNFESLYEMEFPEKEVYYLLKAKCSLMEEIFNVKLGDIIFKKKTKGF